MTDPDLRDLELEPEEPVERRRRPEVSEEIRTAMAVAREYGVGATELARLFGYDPRTVRAAIASVKPEQAQMIATVAAQELSGLQLAVGRKYLMALLERDPNRLRRDIKGNEMAGAYHVTDGSVAGIANQAVQKVEDLRPAAGMGKEGEGGGMMNPVASFIRNQEELARVVRGLSPGVRIKLGASQSLELSRKGSDGSPDPPSASSGPVSADFSVEEDSEP